VHALAALDDTESHALLAAAGVDAAARPRLAELGRGHPLALSLLADVARTGEVPADLADAPDLVAELLQVFTRDVPDEAHRRGLLTCAHAWATTEDLLGSTVGPDRAREVWDWLAGLSFVVRGPNGLYPHDLARDTIDADFRARAPEAYAQLHHDLRAHIVRRLQSATGAARFDPARQLHVMHKSGPLAQMQAVGLIRAGHGGPTPFLAGAEECAQVARLVEEYEGSEEAATFARWVERGVTETWVLRSGEELMGFCCNLVLSGAAPGEYAFDPAVAAVLEHVARTGPPRAGEELLVSRFVGSPGGPADPRATLCAALIDLPEWVSRPLAWAWIVTSAPELLGPLFQYLGFLACIEAPTRGRPLEAYGMDWRRFPPGDWLDFLEERELTGGSGPPPPDQLRPAPVDRAVFAGAVKDALRDLRRDDRLAASVLAGTRLGRGEDDPAASVRAHVARAVDALACEPRGERLARVLDCTYLRAAPSQEAAAEVLDLPFSTYRRHLARATDRLVDILWAHEIGATSLPV
jgi:hypothetical protein